LVEEKTRLNEALKMVVAYDVCRFLGGFPAKQITRFVPTISKRLKNEDSEYYRDYAGAFKRLVTSASEGFRQPSINSLKRSVVDIDLYNQRKKQALRFLVLMENVNSNEVLSFERDLKGCQIEHIMPQSLPPDG
jgi:abortive infection bacteriophage resistance protein